jgi:hypothetical protein
MRKLAASYRLLLALALLIGGVALVAYGLWLVYEPASWLFLGLAALAAALLLELEPPSRALVRRRTVE